VTYPELLTSLYRDHASLLPLWKQSVDESGEAGAFTFVPESYLRCIDLKEVRFEFWTRSRLGAYLRQNGSTDEGYLEIEGQTDRAAEFLVFIVESPDPGGRRPVHIHRIGPVGHN
jgi:hypothetical protein